MDADGNVVLEAENAVLTELDCTNHAELNLVRAASRRFDELSLPGCTLYTSTEPCAMCAGGIYGRSSMSRKCGGIVPRLRVCGRG